MHFSSLQCLIAMRQIRFIHHIYTVLMSACLSVCVSVCVCVCRCWWPSCLDRGALINIEAPRYGTSVVQGGTGQK